VAGGYQFREVGADGHHACAITTDDLAYCWGLNDDGELVDGTRTRRLSPVPVLGGLRFKQVQAGHSHTCGVTKPDGLAYCWGDNSAGA
jgi:alpha-tubulin suppressor-like RCC1 family protein